MNSQYIRSLIICLAFFSFNTLLAQTLTIADFVISGNKKTKTATIHRELTIHRGDTLSIKDLPQILETNRLQLLSTGLFVLVEMNVENWENDRITISIKVQENWYIYPIPIFELADRNFNVWWVEQKRSLRRVNYGMRGYHINLTGRKDRLKTIIQFGFTPKYEIEYTLPALKGLPNLGITGEVLYSNNKNLGYKTIDNKLAFERYENNILLKRFRLGGGVQYRKGQFQYHKAKITYHQNSIHSYVVDSLNPNYFLDQATRQKQFKLSYQFILDKRDFRPYPTKGHRISILLEKHGFGVFKDINSLSLTTTLGKYFPLSQKLTLESNVKGRFSLLRGQQPYNNYQALGYEKDFLRGYEYYVVDGLDYIYCKSGLRFQLFNTKINWKKAMIIPQLRIMPFAVNIHAYYDIGMTNDPQFKNINSLTNKFLQGGGLGLDFVLYNDKIIQLQYSVNHLGENGLFLHYEFNF